MQSANTTQTAPRVAGPEGRLLGEYVRDPRSAWIAMAICGLFLLAGLACAVQLIGTPRPATGNDGYWLDEQAGLRWNLLWAGTLVGLGAGLIGIPWAYYSAVIVGKRRLTLHDEAFALDTKEGTRSYRWDAVQSSTFTRVSDYGSFKGASPGATITLRMASGERFVFDRSYRGLGNLASILSSATYSPILRRTVEQLLAGWPVTFGPLTLGPGGLRYKDKQVGWADLAGATFGNHSIAIWLRDTTQAAKWKQMARLELAQVPDPTALARVIGAATSNANLAWDAALRLILSDPEIAAISAEPASPSVAPARPPKRAALVAIGLLGPAGLAIGSWLIWSGINAGAEAARYQQAPVCAPGESVGCREHERVTVIDWQSISSARGPSSRYVTLQLPGGGTQVVQDESGDLYPTLLIGQELDAELWNGTIMLLDDGEGRQLISSDNPTSIAGRDPVSGVLVALFGVFWLAILWVLVARRRRVDS
jgi:hypothetical protein